MYLTNTKLYGNQIFQNIIPVQWIGSGEVVHITNFIYQILLFPQPPQYNMTRLIPKENTLDQNIIKSLKIQKNIF